jgi:iron complex transport system ATP-binding protein
MIEAKNIYHKIGEKEILNEISFTISDFEFIAILGANGAGKSTLLKCLSGAIIPNKGCLTLNNIKIKDYNLKELAKKRAVLSQSNNINFPFSVTEIVFMGRNPYCLSQSLEEDLTIVDESLKISDAYHLKQHIFSTLSGGEQQRVHIARVLAQIWQQKNSYLFLDEPTSALDLKHQHHLMRIIKDLTKQNVTVIAVMHDLYLTRQYCDKVMLLNNGKIKDFGDVKKVLIPF